MEATITETATGIALTERAAEMVLSFFKEQNADGSALRVFVAGSSCSGLKYGLAIEENAGEDDTEFTHYGVRVVVDAESLSLMGGSTVDYIDNGPNSGFKVENPKATSNCGGCSCGSGGCG